MVGGSNIHSESWQESFCWELLKAWISGQEMHYNRNDLNEQQNLPHQHPVNFNFASKFLWKFKRKYYEQVFGWALILLSSANFDETFKGLSNYPRCGYPLFLGTHSSKLNKRACGFFCQILKNGKFLNTVDWKIQR